MLVPDHPRIDIDPKICAGKPRIAGTRMPVREILGQLSVGATEDQLLEDYPYLVLDDIRAALEYAAETLPHQDAQAAE
jgi:uncharacterized protein (DUF433 family)